MDKDRLTKYAYIYSVSAQMLTLDEDIVFSNNDIIMDTISHTPGTALISINSTGYYAIWFDVQVMGPNKFTLLQNGAPIAVINYDINTGNQQNPGLVVIHAATGDVLTLNNQTNLEKVALHTIASGTQPYPNASILIRKLR